MHALRLMRNVKIQIIALIIVVGLVVFAIRTIVATTPAVEHEKSKVMVAAAPAIVEINETPLPPSSAEQSERSITDWCKIDYGWNPDNCYCGAERPAWTEDQARQTGHRVKKDVIRDSTGRIRRIRVYDYAMPDNGDALSGIANIHTYFQTLEECKTAVASRDIP